MPEMELVSSQHVDARLSDLNPSTSRFMLSMPLLGRPKVPLGEAIKKNHEERESGEKVAGGKAASGTFFR